MQKKIFVKYGIPDVEKEKTRFKRTIWKYFRDHNRSFPWRDTKDPYKILVSEVMLQQTQTSRVLEKYLEFLELFPNFKSLARAKTTEILKAWSGLGYNRRALYLQKTSKIIYEMLGGKLPSDPKELERLPGLGKATARSVLVFSKNIPLVFIETNIRRVFIYLFFPEREKVHDKEIERLVGETLDKKNPRDWYYALMDYGAMLGKLKENPNKKSQHYSKQPKFAGSVRKIRGEILKLLIKENKVSLVRLQKKYAKDLEKFLEALEGLQKDRVVKIEKKVVSIA